MCACACKFGMCGSWGGGVLSLANNFSVPFTDSYSQYCIPPKEEAQINTIGTLNAAYIT